MKNITFTSEKENSSMKFIVCVLSLALVSISLVGCDKGTTQQGSTDLSQEMSEREMDNRRNSSPEPQPSSTVKPIDPFYGTGPGGAFYGNK
jgi:hypothetical protein